MDKPSRRANIAQVAILAVKIAYSLPRLQKPIKKASAFIGKRLIPKR
jgi:hypothetical protein